MKTSALVSGQAQAEADKLASWLAARAGKLTASRMGDAIATLKSGAWAKSRADLIRDLLAERMTGLSIRHYVTPAMEWGTQTEPEAKWAYTAHTGVEIAPCGFYDHPLIDNFGATPDGLIGRDGVVEVKCPTTGTFIEWIMAGAGVVPETHKAQMLAQLACTGRKWAEFVAYDPRIKDERKKLFVCRYEPAAAEIQKVEEQAAAFLADVDKAWEVLNS